MASAASTPAAEIADTLVRLVSLRDAGAPGNSTPAEASFAKPPLLALVFLCGVVLASVVVTMKGGFRIGLRAPGFACLVPLPAGR